MNRGVNPTSTGAGFLPSTVLMELYLLLVINFISWKMAGVFFLQPACLMRLQTNWIKYLNGLFLSIAEYHMISGYLIFMIPYEPWSPRIPHNISLYVVTHGRWKIRGMSLWAASVGRHDYFNYSCHSFFELFLSCVPFQPRKVHNVYCTYMFCWFVV